MMDLLQFHDGLRKFSKVLTLEEITDLCRFFCQKMGFDIVIYALRLPASFSESRLIIVNGGYPERWLARFWERGYGHCDPVIAHCLRSSVPLHWRDLVVAKPSIGHSIMNEAAEFGLRSGITMPVHSAQGELGIFSMTLDRCSPQADKLIEQATPYVHVLAWYLHEAVRRVDGVTAQPLGRQLSSREQECLRWAADGKTSWEIGRLLGTAERTVNFHFNNAMQKLDVSNRQHAVAKAVFQGLINPQPF